MLLLKDSLVLKYGGIEFKSLETYLFNKGYTRRIAYPYNQHKLEPCLLPYVFLGYAAQYKRMWCLELTSQKFYISPHMVFDES